MAQKLRELIRQHYEMLAYLFFGGLATLLNLILYLIFKALFGYEAANSWGNVLDNILLSLIHISCTPLPMWRRWPAPMIPITIPCRKGPLLC